MKHCNLSMTIAQPLAAVLAALAILSGSVSLRAQEANQEPVTQPASGSADSARILQTLSRLRGFLDESKDRDESPSFAPGMSNDSVADRSPSGIDRLPSIPLLNESALSESATGKAGGGDLDSLQRRMDLLRDMVRQRDTNRTDLGKLEAAVGDHLKSSSPDAPSGPAADTHAANSESRPSEGSTKEVPSSQSLSGTLPLLEGGSPVDGLEMGYSLFATGNFPLATKTWQTVDERVTDPVERQWLDLFLASSERLQGNRDLAEAAYREVAAAGSRTWAGRAAATWIQHLDNRKEADEMLESTLASLEALIAESTTNDK